MTLLVSILRLLFNSTQLASTAPTVVYQTDMSKRLHIHVGVSNLQQSVAFYSALWGQPPSKVKSDYAKWMVDEPKVNFAISTRPTNAGVDHLGIQVEDSDEVNTIGSRLKSRELKLFDQGETTCCYANPTKPG